jgi:hypothetical protein
MEIINIESITFGGSLRNGDMIGAANVLQHLRIKRNKPNLKFHLTDGSVQKSDHCQKFHDWMCNNTDYFTKTRGDITLPWKKVNIWDYRDISGDLVLIPNTKQKEEKMVVFPVMDASYNQYRNWPKDFLNDLLKKYRDLEIRKIICICDVNQLCDIDINGYEVSTDFDENLDHILTSKMFLGGDTGTSHFAWSLDSGPELLYYFNSSRSLVHTLPFYLIQGKGTFVPYWLNMENTVWG